MIRPEEVYKIGKIGKPHGVKGEVTLLFSDDVFDRTDADCLVLLIDGILVPFFFEEYRFKTDESAIVKFCDIDTKEQAQELTGCDVFFPQKLSDKDENELTWNDFEGFDVKDEDDGGRLLGTITHVDDSTINILINVRTPDGKDILIPASEEFIKDISTEKREIEVSLPEGLLGLS